MTCGQNCGCANEQHIVYDLSGYRVQMAEDLRDGDLFIISDTLFLENPPVYKFSSNTTPRHVEGHLYQGYEVQCIVAGIGHFGRTYQGHTYTCIRGSRVIKVKMTQEPVITATS